MHAVDCPDDVMHLKCTTPLRGGVVDDALDEDLAVWEKGEDQANAGPVRVKCLGSGAGSDSSVSLSIYIYIYVSVCDCIFMCMCMCMCVVVYMYLHVCGSVSVSVSVHAPLSGHLYQSRELLPCPCLARHLLDRGKNQRYAHRDVPPLDFDVHLAAVLGPAVLEHALRNPRRCLPSVDLNHL